VKHKPLNQVPATLEAKLGTSRLSKFRGMCANNLVTTSSGTPKLTFCLRRMIDAKQGSRVITRLAV